MFRSLTIRNFRGFNLLKVDGFAKLNLITGRNGVGKTAFLEALFLNSGPGNPGLVMNIGNFRGDETLAVKSDRHFRSVFHRLRISEPAKIQATWQSGNKPDIANRNLEIKPIISIASSETSSLNVERVNGVEFNYKSNVTKNANSSIYWEDASTGGGAFQLGLPTGQTLARLATKNVEIADHVDGRFIMASHHSVAQTIHALLTQLAKDRKINEVTKLLRFVDDRIQNILPLTENGENIVYFDLGDDVLMPIFVMGEGIFNLMNLACNFATMSRGIILIDEIENGLHFSTHSKVVEFIIDAISTKNVQVFITTHSDGFISAAAETCVQRKFNDISAYRFALIDKKLTITDFNYEDILNSRDINMEIR